MVHITCAMACEAYCLSRAPVTMWPTKPTFMVYLGGGARGTSLLWANSPMCRGLAPESQNHKCGQLEAFGAFTFRPLDPSPTHKSHQSEHTCCCFPGPSGDWCCDARVALAGMGHQCCDSGGWADQHWHCGPRLCANDVLHCPMARRAVPFHCPAKLIDSWAKRGALTSWRWRCRVLCCVVWCGMA